MSQNGQPPNGWWFLTPSIWGADFETRPGKHWVGCLRNLRSAGVFQFRQARRLVRGQRRKPYMGVSFKSSPTSLISDGRKRSLSGLPSRKCLLVLFMARSFWRTSPLEWRFAFASAKRPETDLQIWLKPRLLLLPLGSRVIPGFLNSGAISGFRNHPQYDMNIATDTECSPSEETSLWA